MELEIKPLSPDLLHDFLHFFDNVGFTDNPDWSGCYCRYFHFAGTPEEWNSSAKDENRECSIELIKKSTLKGYLAYSEGKVVGWCNTNWKNEYELFKSREEYLSPQDDKIVSVVCFVIAPDTRKQGIASSLLDKIIEDYKGTGVQFIEAYPREGAESDAHNFHGHVSMYEKKGFVKLKTLNSIVVMRKKMMAEETT